MKVIEDGYRTPAGYQERYSLVPKAGPRPGFEERESVHRIVELDTKVGKIRLRGRAGDPPVN